MQNPLQFNSSLDNNKRQIHNLGTPQFNSSAANKSYVDNNSSNGNYLNRRTGILLGNLNANNNKIINLAAPLNIEDAVNKQYTDLNFLRVDGSNTMLSSLNMESNQLSNLSDPIDEMLQKICR